MWYLLHFIDQVESPILLKDGILIENLEEAFFVGGRDIRNDPKTYDKAMLDIDSEKWMKAMKSEIDSIHSNQVWTLVDLLESIVPIGYK